MKFDDINNILEDSKDDTKKLTDELTQLITISKCTKTVLGIDLYQYSKMETIKQFVVPFIIDSLITLTCESLVMEETFFFQPSKVDLLKKSIIDTGDGCFIIFDNPIDAIVFLVHFCCQLETLQTRENATTLMKMCNDFCFRYSITTDFIFEYNGKKYGEGLIKCARIMSLDKLNRFLIDNNTYFWFYNNATGIDTLRLHSLISIKQYKEMSVNNEGTSVIFPDSDAKNKPIEIIISQKVGHVQSKKDIVDVYNIFMQVVLEVNSEPYKESKYLPSVISIGNLNMNGLEVD